MGVLWDHPRCLHRPHASRSTTQAVRGGGGGGLRGGGQDRGGERVWGDRMVLKVAVCPQGMHRDVLDYLSPISLKFHFRTS